MIKVTFLLDNLMGGGAEKTLIDILDSLDYSKVDVELILLTREGKHMNSINSNITVKYIFDFKDKSKTSIIIQKVLRKLLFILISKFNMSGICNYIVKNNDRINIAFMEGISSKIISNVNNGKMKVAWVHTNVKAYRWYKKYFIGLKDEIKCYSKFDKIICVSDICIDGFIDLYGKEFSDKVIKIYNPLNEKLIKIKAREKVTDISIPNDYKVLCYVGRLEDEKGIDRLVKVINEIHKSGIKLKLIVIGEGSLLESIKKFIIKNDLVDTIILLGFKENPYKYINISDIVVVPSFFEGFSLITAEALILNKVIVASDSGGPSELLGMGKYGVVCQNSEEGLTSSIKNILTDGNLYAYYSNIEKNIVDEFCIDVILKKIFDIFEKGE